MATVDYSGRALSDLERLTDFLLEDAPTAAGETIEIICDAIGVLQRHPLIGRKRRGLVRELVISRGKTGYVALYRYDSSVDYVLILAVRHQRELRFA